MNAVDVYGWAALHEVSRRTSVVALPMRDGRTVRGRLRGATATDVLLGDEQIPTALLTINLEDTCLARSAAPAASPSPR